MFARKHLKPAVSRNRGNGPRRVRRWHRRLGIGSALAVVLLSVTGIMLNNLDRLYASNDYVEAGWLLDWYQVGYPGRVVSNTDSDAVHQANQYVWADGTIIANRKARLFNQTELLGFHAYQDIEHVFTQSAVHLFTLDGELIESISLEEYALLNRVRATDNVRFLFLENGNRRWLFDLDNLVVTVELDTRLQATADLTGTLSIHGSAHPAAQLAREQSLLKSKVLLDLHSGRIFGSYGSLLMDLFALCFLLLAMTGIAAWVRQMRRERSAK